MTLNELVKLTMLWTTGPRKVVTQTAYTIIVFFIDDDNLVFYILFNIIENISEDT